MKEFLEIFQELQSRISQLSETSNNPYLFEDLNNWINDSVNNIQTPVATPTPLLTKDTVLRVMAAQVHLKNTGHEFFVDGTNSILEAGLSAGLALNYGCSNGNCGKCKARLISGEIKKSNHMILFFLKVKKAKITFYVAPIPQSLKLRSKLMKPVAKKISHNKILQLKLKR